MLRRTVTQAFLAVLAVAAALLVVSRPAVPAHAAAAPVRIMPLGDSITGSPGCWRALLWNRLQNTGFTNIDFVGTLPPQGCGVPYDGDNEGHGGILATGIVSGNQLPPWLAATHPDIVLMHLGTNDVWSNLAPATILAAFSTMVDQMRASNPAMKVLVAQILPMNPSNCPQCAQRVIDFNAAIPAWAAGKSTAASPVQVVDQWTGFNDATDTGDGVHPNDAGNQKISDRWYPALAGLLGGTPPPTSPPPTSPPPTSPPPTTPPPTTPPPTTPPPTTPAGACTATYTQVNAWPGGFQGEVTVHAGTAAVNGWTVRWTFASGQAVTQLWNGADTANGLAHTVANMPYNGGVPAGGSTSFGFTASGPASPAPVPTCTSP